MVFHNGPKYHYHFVIKELANNFEGRFNCLGKNTEKYKTFSVWKTKEVKIIDKYYKKKSRKPCLQFIDSVRFMACSLSGLGDNIAREIHNIECKYGHDNKKGEICRIKYEDVDCCL